MPIVNFNDLALTKHHVGKYVTLIGHCEEIVYLDHDERVIHLASNDDISNVSAIWLNSGYGAHHNHEFGFLLKDEAISTFIGQYGILSNDLIRNFNVVCNNGLLESMQGTDKPYVLLNNIEEFNEFSMS